MSMLEIVRRIREVAMEDNTELISRRELLSIISDYTSRRSQSHAREGMTTWALASGVILLGAYIFSEIQSLFAPSTAAAFIEIILFVEIARDILANLKSNKIHVIGVVNMSHILNHMHYSLMAQIMKWLLIYGIVSSVLSDAFILLTVYTSYKVLSMLVLFLARNTQPLQKYAQTIAYGSGKTGSLGAYTKATILAISFIHYSKYIVPISMENMRMCIGMTLIIYAIQYLVNKFLAAQGDVRLSNIERKLLTSRIRVQHAAEEVAEIMFGKTPKQVLDEEFNRFMNEIDIPDASDNLPTRAVAYLNAKVASQKILRRLKKAKKYEPDIAREYVRKVYRILYKLESLAAKRGCKDWC